jgi:predicted DNA-binding protein (MmcQ/YjbR family)
MLDMNIETLREYCMSKKGATECFPFDETSLVFKVMNKMFALTDLEDELWINLKCDPEIAVSLREQYPFVEPGYHMNKKHWNTIRINNGVPDKLIHEWIDHSYNLVVKSLTQKKRAELFKL